jgi:uncharacterized membrane protein YfcA
MDGLRTALFVALAVLAASFIVLWQRAERARRKADQRDGGIAPTFLQTAIGFVTNFFDTLGIGSFAPTTTAFKLWHIVPDERIPGTLNAGHALPVVIQAFIFVAVIEVDAVTLVLMIAAAVIGAWLGAGVVAALPRRPIQIGIAVALFLAAVFFTMSNLGWFPAGGESLRLASSRLGLGVAVNFLLGALNTLGIGMYAPCMVLISLLGMNPRAAFPIMMGSAAFLMPVGSLRFIQRERYSLRPALGLALGGIPAVLLAAFVVKSLPITALRWLIAAVVLYTAWAMLRSAAAERRQGSQAAA